MITIHIGLAKCASSSLQRYVFPEMEKFNNNIEFNNKKLFELSRKHHMFPLDTKEKKIFDEILQNGKDHLISNESLINWDPAYVKEAADLNLEIFGRKANVIIVVRDSMEYFTSIYQQKIQEGNIISADSFFVKPDIYNKIRTIFYHKGVIRFFNHEEFSLEKIYNIYNERFDSVFFVPLSKINDLLFLKQIYKLTDDQIKELRSKLSSAPRANKSYSSLAMKLTFKREKILRLFGLKSNGSWDHSPLLNLPMPLNSSPQNQSNLSILNMARGFLIRFRNRLRWRALMQLLVNKYLPYEKYKLPKGLPILQENLNNDSVFLKKIEKDYYVYQKLNTTK